MKALGIWLCLLLAAFVAYEPCLDGPFLFGDVAAIPENPRIQSLSASLSPESVPALAYRQATQFTFALNYRIGGLDPKGYHLGNILIHGLNACLLWRVCLAALRRRGGDLASAAERWALLLALVWVVHPLASEPVCYIVHRAELVAVFFGLLSLLLLIGSSTRPWLRYGWVATCWLAMLAKETMAPLPFLLFLFDRTYLSQSSGEAWRNSWKFYLATLVGWIPVLLGVLSGLRAGPGAETGGVSAWSYLLTQSQAVLNYLKLTVLPVGLTADYLDWPLVAKLSDVAIPVSILAALVIAGLIGSYYRTVWGFLLMAFFLLLAPSSSIVPLPEPVAERRFYLPLYLVLAFLLGSIMFLRNRIRSETDRNRPFGWFGFGVAGLVLLTLVAACRYRASEYGSEVQFWSRAVTVRPDNHRAHYNLAMSLARAGDLGDAEAQIFQSMQLGGEFAEAWFGLGKLALNQGNIKPAIKYFETASNAVPHLDDPGIMARIHFNLGFAHGRNGNAEAAEKSYRDCLKLDPRQAAAHYNLAYILAQTGRDAEAAQHRDEALRLKPELKSLTAPVVDAGRLL